MSTFAIGDIHGQRAALEEVLGSISRELEPSDTVVFLGDYIDDGPDTKGCIDAILALRDSVNANVVHLEGNHEDWMLRSWRDPTRHSWLLGMGAWATIRSYSPRAEGALRSAVEAGGSELYLGKIELPYRVFFDALPESHREFFRNLRPLHRTPDCLCVHAGVNPFAPLDAQSENDVVWGHRDFPERYDGQEVVVYGHTNTGTYTRDGWPIPRIANRTYGINTIADGVLTAVKLPEGRVLQSGRHEVARR
jgi:serine/threonine protein phosphatase 1